MKRCWRERREKGGGGNTPVHGQSEIEKKKEKREKEEKEKMEVVCQKRTLLHSEDEER